MSPAMHWTRERIIDAIQEFNRLYGRPPGAMDWNVSMAKVNGRQDLVDRFYADACYPHATNVYGKGRHFASWREAIAAAGLVPRARGERGPTSAYALEHGGQAWGPQRTHCKHGHEFTPENTRSIGANGRRCRECERITNRATYARRMARFKATA